MTPEEVKRDFIAFMERLHSRDAYPRNFFGVLTCLLIEHDSVSQDRIVELTNYSQAAVSIALQKIQLVMPVTTIKKTGDRKKYYTFNGSPEDFVLMLMKKRTDVSDIDKQMVKELLNRTESLPRKHKSVTRFSNHLKGLLSLLNFMEDVRKRSIELLRKSLETGKFSESYLSDLSKIKINEITRILSHISPTNLSSQESTQAQHVFPSEFLALKREFSKGIQRSINPLFSQSAAHLVMVIHSVMIDGSSTQEAIQESTELSRSTISEILSHGLERQLLRVERVSGSRVKIYLPNISLGGLLTSHYSRSVSYSKSVRSKVIELISKIDTNNQDSRDLLKALHEIKCVYSILEDFTANLESFLMKTIDL
ncbi:MAG: hypothetical protein JW779_01740 [Candidatus Thorarchaeota archaeon]|nr:hypothetical protein [Candidatus Thorarchaeota archaeon]